MKEQPIEYNTAKLAKEKGFDEITDMIYMTNHTVETIFENINRLKHSDGNNPFISAPTQSLLAKWLREVHDITNLNVFPVYKNDILQGYKPWRGLLHMNNLYLFNPKPIYNTYEEALEVGLFEELKLIK